MTGTSRADRRTAPGSRSASGLLELEARARDRRLRDRTHAERTAEEALGPGRAEDHAGDLSEPERDDREVVAAQPQHRRTDQRPDQGRDHHHDRQRQPEGEAGAEGRRLVALEGDPLPVGEDRHDVGPHGEERDVPEVEQAGVADDDVQPQPEEHEDADGAQDAGDDGPHEVRQDEQQPGHHQPGHQGSHPPRPEPALQRMRLLALCEFRSRVARGAAPAAASPDRTTSRQRRWRTPRPPRAA